MADAPPITPTLADDPLIGRLRALRAGWAREAGLSPGYVFSNETLEALARERPGSPQALARIKGIGPSKLERYGSALLAAIAEAPAPAAPRDPGPSPTPEPPRPTPPPAPVAPASSSSYVPTEEWTWRLLDRGFTLDEAAAIRGLEPAAILRHATWVAREGRPVPLSAFSTPEQVARWDAWHRDHGDAPPPDDPAGRWPLYLACRQARP